MTTMAAAFKAKGGDFKQIYKAAPTESKNRAPKPDVPAPTQEPKRQPVKQETVTFEAGTKFVLVFGCPRVVVPEKIQVLQAGGGGTTGATPEDANARRFAKVRIDLEGLMSRCVVGDINVRVRNGFCRVYVNCLIAAGGVGLGRWNDVSYGPFVRKEVTRVWKRAIMKKSTNGSTTLELRGVCKDAAETMIRFGIEG